MDYQGMPSQGGAPAPAAGEDFSATSGHPLAEGSAIAGEEPLIAALKTVFDPEIPVDIYELGLIYKFDIDDKGGVKINMSLTSPGCPVAGELPQWVADAASGVEGIGEVEVTLVWEPTWSPELMTEDAKLALGMFED